MSSCRCHCFSIHSTRGLFSAQLRALAMTAALACVPSAQAQSQPSPQPYTQPQSQVNAHSNTPKSTISLDDAIDLAIEHNHTLKAARTQIQQSQAQEVTAALRPNPVLSWDTQFLPFFNPGNFSADNLDQLSQFDVGVGYLWERGGKRARRIEAARDQTTVTKFTVADNERGIAFNVAQQFVGALLAKANVDLASQDLKSFQQTADIADYQYKVGQISEGDALKIRLQLLQFQSDLSAAKLAQIQAMAQLRQLLGYDAVTDDYQLEGDLKFQPLTAGLDDLQAKALNERADLLAARQGVVASRSQHMLAIANGKRDFNSSFNYSHVSGTSSASLFFNIELPIFDRNQGEKARTQYAITQAEETANAATETVMTDIRNAYEAVKVDQQIVQLYESGYLKNATDSLQISEYAYKKGAASLLDYLDSERTFRSIQLAYRQALAAHMLALEQLKQATGTRRLP